MREKMKRRMLICSAILFALLMVIEPISIMGNNGVMVASAASAKLNKKSITLTNSSSYQLKVNGTKSKVKWSSSKKSVASVATNGKVMAKKAGNTVISAKVGTKKYTCKVKVLNFKLNKTSLTINAGGTYELKVTGTNKSAKFSSMNTNVASVDSRGIVKGIGSGSTTIKVKVGSESYKVTVEVKAVAMPPVVPLPIVIPTPVPTPVPTPKPIQTVVNCPDSINIQYGETQSYTITAGGGFTYSRGDDSLLDVSVTPRWFYPGDNLTMVVTGKAVGSTSLTFTSDGGWSKQVLVNVTGTTIPSSIVSTPLRNCTVSNLVVYKQYGAANPSFFVKCSLQNNNVIASTEIAPMFEFYDQAGNLVTEGSLYWENPTAGTHEYSGFLRPYGTEDFSKIVSCKIVDVDVRMALEAPLDSGKIVIPALNLNLGSNIALTAFKIDAYTTYLSILGSNELTYTYSITNKAATAQSFGLYLDYYDEAGNLISQGENALYDYFYLDAGETELRTSCDQIYGSLTNGTIASIRARVVMK